MGSAERRFAMMIARPSFSEAIPAIINIVPGLLDDPGTYQYTAIQVISRVRSISARKLAVDVQMLAKIRMDFSLLTTFIAHAVGWWYDRMFRMLCAVYLAVGRPNFALRHAMSVTAYQPERQRLVQHLRRSIYRT